MKTNYEIRGDATALLITRKNGETIEALIDTEDLDRVRSVGSWSATFNKHKQSYYVIHGSYARTIEGKYSRSAFVQLGRLVLGSAKRFVIDHKNGNTLDNRKANLRYATPSQNSLNRMTLPSPINRNGRWGAQLMYQGKMYWLGFFPEREQAVFAILGGRLLADLIEAQSSGCESLAEEAC